MYKFIIISYLSFYSFSIFADQHIPTNKETFLQTLAEQFYMQSVDINLKEKNKSSHISGDKLHFVIRTYDEKDVTLTLFNLNNNGKLEFLFPVERRMTFSDSPWPATIRVIKPFGNEHLIAILCENKPIALNKLLSKSDDIPDPIKIISALKGKDCQIGQYNFFTSAK